MNTSESIATDIKERLSDWGFDVKKKSLIIGPLPPPVGGVSIHVSRLLPLLKNADIDFEVFNTSKSLLPGSNFFNLFLKLLSGRVHQIHVHTISNKILCAIYLAKFFTSFSIYFYVHNPTLFIKKNRLADELLFKLIKETKQINAVSDIVRTSILDHRKDLAPLIKVNSPFLPPDTTNSDRIKELYPQSLITFLEKHSPLIIINAYRIHFKDNTDVYGVDLSIDLLIRLSEKYPKSGLILALGRKDSHQSYLEAQVEKLKEKDLQSRFYILEGFQNLWCLFEDCDIMLRPTLYDGFGISVSEAILMNTKVIASDSTIRQNECVLFRNRDIVDLEEKAIRVIDSLN